MNIIHTIINNLANIFVSSIFIWQLSHCQDLNVEEYDWYGYGETYGSEAKLRTDYRYKQVRVVQKLGVAGGVTVSH